MSLVVSAAQILADAARPAPYSHADWLTPAQVMAIFGWTRHRLDHAPLPYQLTLGGHRRYRRADVETFRKTAAG